MPSGNKKNVCCVHPFFGVWSFYLFIAFNPFLFSHPLSSQSVRAPPQSVT
jgi:hypothetical protein